MEGNLGSTAKNNIVPEQTVYKGYGKCGASQSKPSERHVLLQRIHQFRSFPCHGPTLLAKLLLPLLLRGHSIETISSEMPSVERKK